MSIVTQKITALDTASGKYAINVQVQWDGVASSKVTIPGLTGVTDGLSDDFDLHNIQGNVALPPIKSVQGTIRFRSNVDVIGTGSGAGFLFAPDTQEIIAFAQNRNTGGILAALAGSYVANTPVPGVVGDNFVSFCAPFHTLGSVVRIYKLTDLNPSVMHGFGNFTFFTFDVLPYNFGW